MLIYELISTTSDSNSFGYVQAYIYLYIIHTRIIYLVYEYATILVDKGFKYEVYNNILFLQSFYSSPGTSSGENS